MNEGIRMNNNTNKNKSSTMQQIIVPVPEKGVYSSLNKTLTTKPQLQTSVYNTLLKYQGKQTMTTQNSNKAVKDKQILNAFARRRNMYNQTSKKLAKTKGILTNSGKMTEKRNTMLTEKEKNLPLKLNPPTQTNRINTSTKQPPYSKSDRLRAFDPPIDIPLFFL